MFCSEILYLSFFLLIIPEHAEYLEKFLVDFERELKHMIDDGIKARQEKAVNDPLSLECVEHVSFAKSKAAIFQGRGKVMDNIQGKLIGDGKQE